MYLVTKSISALTVVILVTTSPDFASKVSSNAFSPYMLPSADFAMESVPLSKVTFTKSIAAPSSLAEVKLPLIA